MNVDLLVSILISKEDYWIFQKSYKDSFGKNHTSIFLAAIPLDIDRFEHRRQITLEALEKLNRAHLQNVFLSENYAPFQHGITLYECNLAFPVLGDKKEFLKKAISLQTDDIFEYKKIIESPEKV